MSVLENLARVSARIAATGRNPDEVTIVAVTKGFDASVCREALAAGLHILGENRVQEALGKMEVVEGASWHLIGHLQTNKAKIAADAFDLIQSLDSVRLAGALAKARHDPPIAVLVEVNLGGEASKTGVPPDDVEALIDAVLAKVEVSGLMAIPPPGPNPEHSRPYFAQLRRLGERLAAATGLALSELSMGMSDDFEVAIEEGATIVRVGRAIFGERPR
jgi:PLP dependent protein